MRSTEILKSKVVFTLSVLCLLVGLFMLSPLRAQERSGALQGTAIDQTGGVLPGVTVTITNKATNRTVSTITGADGNYVAKELEPGHYGVKFELAGFSTGQVADVNVLLGQTLKLDAKMQVGGVAQEVAVTEAIPLIDTQSTVISHNVTAEEIDRLPKGRSFQSVANVLPTVNTGDIEGGTQVGGASSAENAFTIDGIVTNSLLYGQSRQDTAMEYLQEVQVKTAGINAEYGGALGGVVSAVTKSGGNQFHGEFHYYLSGNTISAPPVRRLILNPTDDISVNYFQDPKQKNNNHEVGGSVGGPIVKDRLYFYSSVSPRFRRRTQDYMFSAGTDPGTIEQKQLYMNMFNKISYDASRRVRGNFTWLYTPTYSKGTLPAYDGYGPNFLNSSKTANAINGNRGYLQPQSSYTGSIDLTLSNTSVLSGRGGYFWDDYHDRGVPNLVNTRYSVPTTGVAGIPANLQGPTGTENTPRVAYEQWDLTTRAYGNVDYSISGSLGGYHNFKAGAGIQKTVNNVNKTYLGGGYVNIFWGRSFTSVATRQTGTGTYGYYEFNDGVATVGSGGAAITSLYAQDQWTIGRRLTLNLGLRTEREVIPSFQRSIKDFAIKFNFGDKIAPRLGASFDLMGDGKVKIYGSWGRYFDWTKYELARGSYGGDVWHVFYRSLDTLDIYNLAANGLPGRDLWNPAVPNSNRNRRVPNFNATDPQLKPMRQDNTAVGVDYQLNAQTVFSAQYLHNNLNRTIEDLGAIVNGDEVYAITNPGEGFSKLMDPSGTATPAFPTPRPKRQYDAVEISLNRRFAKNWYADASYVWSRLYGNYSGLVDTDEVRTPATGTSYAAAQQPTGTIVRPGASDHRAWDVPEIVWDSRGHLGFLGLLATDRPNVFKFHGAYTMNFGTEIGGYYYIGSGTPLSTYAWDNNSVPLFVNGRGDLGRTSVFSQTDLLVSHEVKVSEGKKVRFEMNMQNLFNQKTARHIYNDYNRRDRASSQMDMSRINLYNGYDYKALIATTAPDGPVKSLDPRFGKQDLFNPGFAGRFGVKFMF